MTTAAKKATAKKTASAKKTSAAKRAAPAKKAAATKTAARRPRKRDMCFVMSPFGGWYDQYYAEVYCPAIDAAGLRPSRADDLYRPSAIVQDIWAYVKESRVMLADLTDKNPNVFYELGLAHALDKPVVLLTQSIDDVPFDLRALRVISYETAAPNWAATLQTSITNALREVMAAPESAVLQPFQKEALSTPPTAEEQQDPVIQQLMREVNLLRSEVLRRSNRRERDEIPPDEARDMIQRYVQRGMPTNLIIDRLAPLGPPTSWIRREVMEARKAARQPTLMSADDD